MTHREQLNKVRDLGISICDLEVENELDDWNTVNVYRLFDGFKAEKVIDIINEYWQIELAELED